MHRTVIAELGRELVPLATASEAKDNAIEGFPGVDAPASGFVGWILG